LWNNLITLLCPLITDQCSLVIMLIMINILGRSATICSSGTVTRLAMKSSTFLRDRVYLRTSSVYLRRFLTRELGVFCIRQALIDDWCRHSHLVLQFWWNFELPKFTQNFAKTLGEALGNILPPPWKMSMPQRNSSWEITYSMLSNIFIFDNIFKLEFLLKFYKLWQHFWKIQSLGLTFSRIFHVKYWRNFHCRNTSPIACRDSSSVLGVAVKIGVFWLVWTLLGVTLVAISVSW